jgi:hypothetical protein
LEPLSLAWYNTLTYSVAIYARQLMVITVPPELEQALKEHAQQQGIPPEQLALNSLHQTFGQPNRPADQDVDTETLADFLQPYIGILSSAEVDASPGMWSEDTGDRFTQILLERQRRGEA